MAGTADDVPRWIYLVGATVIFGVLGFAPGVLDKVSNQVSDHVVDDINDMRSTTTTSTTTTTVR